MKNANKFQVPKVQPHGFAYNFFYFLPISACRSVVKVACKTVVFLKSRVTNTTRESSNE